MARLKEEKDGSYIHVIDNEILLKLERKRDKGSLDAMKEKDEKINPINGHKEKGRLERQEHEGDLSISLI
ncbi:Hypothetical predicted protein [Olea europaea subsp. europaea]|uniref:Uncharacterized protein n=1 Tax=Olea europaea subsp. europaea TaxID=158383 RepID=A0A8S0TEC3_OLEEU|nr:Hypothetical predicted protein [Olea europaea subsp. europaea]